jgi:hypothetical protein
MPKAKGVGAGKEINFFQSALTYFEKNDRRGSCSDIKGSVEGKLKCFAI